MENFVDFVEDKGEFWYNTTDILSVLGYTKDNKGRIISMQMRGIPFYMTPNKQINGEVWWNDVTLTKFKHKLSSDNSLKKKLANWPKLEKVMQDSKTKTILGGEVSTSIDFVTIYKQTNSWSGFVSVIRKLGYDVKGITSWTQLSKKRPELYALIEPHFSKCTRNRILSQKSKDVEDKDAISGNTFEHNKEVGIQCQTETEYLLSSPKNKERLENSIHAANRSRDRSKIFRKDQELQPPLVIRACKDKSVCGFTYRKDCVEKEVKSLDDIKQILSDGFYIEGVQSGK